MIVNVSTVIEEIPSTLTANAKLYYLWHLDRYGNQWVEFYDLLKKNPFTNHKRTLRNYHEILKKHDMAMPDRRYMPSGEGNPIKVFWKIIA